MFAEMLSGQSMEVFGSMVSHVDPVNKYLKDVTIMIFNVVDPFPHWIRIQELCGSGSGSTHLNIG